MGLRPVGFVKLLDNHVALREAIFNNQPTITDRIAMHDAGAIAERAKAAEKQAKAVAQGAQEQGKTIGAAAEVIASAAPLLAALAELCRQNEEQFCMLMLGQEGLQAKVAAVEKKQAGGCCVVS